ncbi:MAG TPA: sugar ABC transporter permease, partial [Rubellimicrobium sp.]|nr:sugar ABC transporter permease [Rubellimicrobium sp.]
ETCQPFGGCTTTTTVDAAATAQLREEQPLGQFNALGTYVDRNHLAFSEIGEILRTASGPGEVVSRIYNLPLYKALAFTITYCLLVTPLALILGLLIALAVNTVPRLLKGPVIFFSLVPMLITPLVGALILYWMLNAEGILGAAIQNLFNDPTLSTRTSAPLTWATLIAYGTWTNAPFSFIVFYAGLQAVPRDTLEAAMIDGASRLERIRYVVLPSLKPLILFVLLVQLMDNFRVFEPIISFNAAANATSLSYLIYSSLNTQTTQLFGSAAATSVITIGFIAVLIVPVLLRIARELSAVRT